MNTGGTCSRSRPTPTTPRIRSISPIFRRSSPAGQPWPGPSPTPAKRSTCTWKASRSSAGPYPSPDTRWWSSLGEAGREEGNRRANHVRYPQGICLHQDVADSLLNKRIKLWSTDAEAVAEDGASAPDGRVPAGDRFRARSPAMTEMTYLPEVECIVTHPDAILNTQIV